MKLSEVKNILPTLQNVEFKLEDGTMVPLHFHITEVGMIKKDFIDCGGTVRQEQKVNFQLWSANDVDHRLQPEKLLKIIELSESVLLLQDDDVEVEYQNNTIGKFGLDFDGRYFILQNQATACLASDKCGTSSNKTKMNISELTESKAACCSPGSGCC